jgi:hypothetical protein
MTQRTEISCDACGTDLTYTGNSAGYRLMLVSQAKARYPDSVAVTDRYEPDPMPDGNKHFCGHECLATWVDGP